MKHFLFRTNNYDFNRILQMKEINIQTKFNDVPRKKGLIQN